MSGSIIDDFRILRMVGRGGMGEVYEAIQVSLGRRVALKVLPQIASMDERSRRRFRQEALASASLHHPNIVPVYSVGSHGNIHFYAMQYIEGASIAAVVNSLSGKATIDTASMAKDITESDSQSNHEAQSKPLNNRASLLELNCGTESYFRSVAKMISQVASALQYSHEMGIIHRDIKPSNILVDSSGNVWVADFGLAKLPDSNLTETIDVMGTIRYMSPEQASGRTIALDGRTDVYSLGITLYELLTLQPAFAAEDRRALLRKVLEVEPPPPKLIRSEVPEDLNTITLKASAKEPELRYQTAHEFAADLQRFLDDQPILAKPPTLLDRTKKWTKRNRTLVAVSATTTLIFLIAGVVGLTISLLTINAQRNNLKRSLDRESTALLQANEAKELADKTLAAEQQARTNERRMAYSQALSLAHVEYKNGNIEVAESLLEQSPAEFRDWEWGYIWQLCHSQLNTLPIEAKDLSHIMVSTAGELFAVSSGDYSVWSIPYGQHLRTEKLGLSSQPWRNSRFSVDGQFIAQYGLTPKLGEKVEPGTIELFQAKTGQLVQVMEGIKAAIQEVAIDAVNRRVAVAAEDGLRVWSMGKDVAPKVVSGKFYNVAFSRNGKLLAARDVKKRILILNASNLNAIKTIENGWERGRIKFSSDERVLAITSVAGDEFMLRDIQSESLIRKIDLQASQDDSVEFCPNGRWIAYVDSIDHSIVIAEIVSGKIHRRIPQRADTIRSLKFSPDGSILAIHSGRNQVDYWDMTVLPDQYPLTSIIRGEPRSYGTASPTGLTISPSGKLAALHYEEKLYLYSLENQKQWKTLIAPERTYRLFTAIFDEERKQVSSLTTGGFLQWNYDTDSIVRSTKESMTIFPMNIEFPESNKPQSSVLEAVKLHSVFAPQFSCQVGPNRILRYARNAKSDTWLQEFNFETNQIEREFAGTRKGSPYCVAASGDGTKVTAAATNEFCLAQWSQTTDHEDWSTNTTNRILRMHYNHRGDRLAIVDSDGNLELLNSEDGSRVSRFRLPSQPRVDFAFSPNDRRIAVGLGQPFKDIGEIRILDVETSKVLMRIPTSKAIECVAFTPNGDQLLASDYAGNLWSFNSRQQSLTEKIADYEVRKANWHDEQSIDAMKAGEFYAASFHLNQLQKLRPDSTGLEKRQLDIATRRFRAAVASGSLANLENKELEEIENTITLKDISLAFRISAEYISRQNMAAHQRLVRKLRALVTSETDPITQTFVFRLACFCPDSVDEPLKLRNLIQETYSNDEFSKRFLGGLVAYRCNEFAESRAELKELVKLKVGSPSYPIGWIFLAMAEAQLGNRLAAIEAHSNSVLTFESQKESRKQRKTDHLVDLHFPYLQQEFQSILNKNKTENSL
ncbi:MAG: protein kinase [Pirellulales bacterium]